MEVNGRCRTAAFQSAPHRMAGRRRWRKRRRRRGIQAALGIGTQQVQRAHHEQRREQVVVGAVRPQARLVILLAERPRGVGRAFASLERRLRRLHAGEPYLRGGISVGISSTAESSGCAPAGEVRVDCAKSLVFAAFLFGGFASKRSLDVIRKRYGVLKKKYWLNTDCIPTGGRQSATSPLLHASTAPFADRARIGPSARRARTVGRRLGCRVRLCKCMSRNCVTMHFGRAGP